MARISSFEKVTMDRNVVHGEVNCTYSVFDEEAAQKYIQFDTYGSTSRKIRGKKSQTIQLDRDACRRLVEILRNEGMI